MGLEEGDEGVGKRGGRKGRKSERRYSMAGERVGGWVIVCRKGMG
jgi:hypothetical protein